MPPKTKTSPASISTIRSTMSCACRSEEHTSELQSRPHLVCRLLLEKKNNIHQVPNSITSSPSNLAPHGSPDSFPYIFSRLGASADRSSDRAYHAYSTQSFRTADRKR